MSQLELEMRRQALELSRMVMDREEGACAWVWGDGGGGLVAGSGWWCSHAVLAYGCRHAPRCPAEPLRPARTCHPCDALVVAASR